MAKKQKSFAEKASSSPKGKDLVHVKFIKSVPSERDGFWRFNESMISMEKGETLDATLKKMDDEANLADIEMPSLEMTDLLGDVIGDLEKMRSGSWDGYIAQVQKDINKNKKGNNNVKR